MKNSKNKQKTKQTKQKTVLLALSGGVDSAVSAIMLKKQGYKVLGCFFKCFSDTKDPLTGECNWIKDKKDAQKISALLKIPFLTLDLEKQYKKQVIKPLIEGYKKGLTPNPDISCNTLIKFPWLIKEAKKLKADYIATGHYARIKKTSDNYYLLKGKDNSKDQSYFLYELSQPILAKTLFPVGNLTKNEVRKIAKANHIPVWDKLGTRGICFIGKVNLKSFLENKIKNRPGPIKDSAGNIIGNHPGIFYYTTGQRAHQSLGINFQKPKEDNKKWFIAEKIKPNTLIVAPEGHPLLKKNKILVHKLYLINPKDKIPTKIKARIRHLGKLLEGKLTKHNNRYQFTLAHPQEGIAEGQSIVLYNNAVCLGGGQISLSNRN